MEVSTLVGEPGRSGFQPGPLRGIISLPSSLALVGDTLYVTTLHGVVKVTNLP